jgi:hypothetical protein
MTVEVKLIFASAAAAAAALARMDRIDPLDRPDAGGPPIMPGSLALTPVQVPAPPLASATPQASATVPNFVDPIALFGGAAAPVSPPAPFTADAAVLPTAPVAPLAGVPTPPPAASLPVPPAPAAAAPTAPAAPTTSASVEVDGTNLPWDARIHAANKARNKDGSWRAKKGLNDGAMVAKIEAELRATVTGAIPAPPVGAAVPPAPAPAAAPAAPVAPPVAAAVSAGLEFGQFMAFLAPHLGADFQGANAKLSAILTPLGVPSVGALSAAPHLIPAVKQRFEVALAAA